MLHGVPLLCAEAQKQTRELQIVNHFIAFRVFFKNSSQSQTANMHIHHDCLSNIKMCHTDCDVHINVNLVLRILQHFIKLHWCEVETVCAAVQCNSEPNSIKWSLHSVNLISEWPFITAFSLLLPEAVTCLSVYRYRKVIWYNSNKEEKKDLVSSCSCSCSSSSAEVICS